MQITSEFCWHKAAECHRLGEMSAGAQEEFFVKSRNSWITIANQLNVVGAGRSTTHDETWDAILQGRG